MNKYRLKRRLWRVALYLVYAFIFFWAVAPFYWLIISSLTLKSELMSVPPHWIPYQFSFNNYLQLLGGATVSEAAGKFLKAMLNSSVVALATAGICLLAGSLAGYAFARLKFPGKASLSLLVLITQMIPTAAILIPLYIIMQSIGLLDNVVSLILADTTFTLPFVIWMMRSFFLRVPKDLEDAAKVDGASGMDILFRIVMPLAITGIAAVSMIAFIWSWGEFFFALVFTSSYASKTIPIAIAEFTTRSGADYGMIAAGGVLASLPAIVLVLIFQKYIIQGLTAGALKR